MAFSLVAFILMLFFLMAFFPFVWVAVFGRRMSDAERGRPGCEAALSALSVLGNRGGRGVRGGREVVSSGGAWGPRRCYR